MLGVPKSDYYRSLAKKKSVSVAPDMTVFYNGLQIHQGLITLVSFFLTFLLLSALVDSRGQFWFVPMVLSILVPVGCYTGFMVSNKIRYPVVMPLGTEKRGPRLTKSSR